MATEPSRRGFIDVRKGKLLLSLALERLEVLAATGGLFIHSLLRYYHAEPTTKAPGMLSSGNSDENNSSAALLLHFTCSRDEDWWKFKRAMKFNFPFTSFSVNSEKISRESSNREFLGDLASLRLPRIASRKTTK
jgi:hypothetical protein